MLKTTRDMILPTAITGSYPRPLWFDRSLDGRSFKAALGDSLFREQYLGAVAAIINAQEAGGLDIVADGDSRFDLNVGDKSWFFYPIERLGGISGHPPTPRGWVGGAGAKPGPIPGGGRGRIARRSSPTSCPAARWNTARSGRSHSASPTSRSSSAQSARRASPAC